MSVVTKFLFALSACAGLASASAMAQDSTSVHTQTLNHVHLVATAFGGSLQPGPSGANQWKIGLRLASPLAGATIVTSTVTQNLPAPNIQQAIIRPGAATTVDLTCPTVRVMSVGSKVIASAKDCTLNSYK